MSTLCQTDSRRPVRRATALDWAFIGNKFHVVSGKPEGGGLPDLAFKGLPAHDVLEIPANFGTN